MTSAVEIHGRTGSQKDGGSSDSSAPSTLPGSASKISSEAMYLHQKLRDVLGKQIVIDEKHQRDLILSRHQLRRLYDENASYRSIITAAEYRKRNDGRVACPSDSPSVTDAELAMFFTRCTLAKRNQNRLKYELTRLEQVVKEEERREKENLQVAQLSSDILDHAALEVMLSGNVSVGLRIKKIEDELNAVLGQQQVVAMITDKYREQIQNFANERFQYANHIKALEQQYLDRHREHLQMITLFQNATYDYEKMVSQRAAFSEHMKKQRNLKEKLLQDRQTEVKHAILEGERYVRGITDLQLELDEESQLLEQVEMEQQELLKRQARQRDTDTLLGSGGGGSRRSSPRHNNEQSGDAEAEEQLSAYHLAIQHLLKETKTENRQELIPFFQKELLQYEQLRAQVAVKLNRRNQLEEEVKRLRETYDNVKVCAATASPVAAHSSATLEAELQSFLEEAEAELGKLVREGESHRILLQDLAQHGNQLAGLVSAYRPEIAIRAMKEEDSLLPIHFTALTQKLLSLADEVTTSTQSVRNDRSLPHQRTAIPPPPAVTPVIIPENNLRVTVKQRIGEMDVGHRPPRGGRWKRSTAGIATGMTSVACDPALLQQHRRGDSSNAGAGGRGSDFSFLSSDSSAVLMTEACDSAQPATVSSDLDDDDAPSSSSSSSFVEGNRRVGGIGGVDVGDAYSTSAAANRGLRPATSSVSSGMRQSHASHRLHGKSRGGFDFSASADYNDAGGRRTLGGGLPRSNSSGGPAFAAYGSIAGGGVPGSGRRGRGGSIGSDTPLRREELKRVSWAIKKRETKRLANEERRRAGMGKNL